MEAHIDQTTNETAFESNSFEKGLCVAGNFAALRRKDHRRYSNQRQLPK